jgi:hypothetical protein
MPAGLTDLAFVVLGIVMLGGLLMVAGSVSRDDPRLRARWEARFDQEARQLRRTDATGVLRCRKCGANGTEKSGICRSCGSVL